MRAERRSPRWLWLVLALLALIGMFAGVWFLAGRRPVELPDPPYPTQGGEEVSIDFENLQRQNPDICAWLQVPGADVNHPVAQRPGEDEYYLHADLNGNYKDGGSLFTQETYNSRDFTDPVTIIYGHEMEDGSMFGDLQPWASRVDLEEGEDFYVYLPGRRLTYRVYAAAPWSSKHILFYYDFSREGDFQRFFQAVRSVRSLNAQVAEEYAPSFGDRIVILETCLAGDDSQRFLVIGVLAEETPT